MNAPLTIWNPIKVFKALRWDSSLSAGEYLRASLSITILLILIALPLVFLGYLIASRPLLVMILIPFILVVFAFFMFMMLKLLVMRLHAFNLSGWWILVILGIFSFLGYLEDILIGTILYSIFTYFAYFYEEKISSRWDYLNIFTKPAIKTEWVMLILFASWTWFNILGYPLFSLIDMI